MPSTVTPAKVGSGIRTTHSSPFVHMEIGDLLMAVSGEPGEESAELQTISIYALLGIDAPKLYKSSALLKGSLF